jgi:hypothetical protein
LHLAKESQQILNPLNLKFFALHKVEVFYIVLGIELKIHNKNKNPKILHFHFLKSQKVRGDM